MRRPLAAFAAALPLLASGAGARVLLTQEEALGLLFPGCAVERRTVYLTEDQVRDAERDAGTRLVSAIVNPYVATCGGRPGGVALFDTHVVRTLAETVMVAIDPDGRLLRVEVIAFDEPPDYLPRPEWYRQFDGRGLDPELELRHAIRPVTGASLSARAATDAARRALALARQLAPGLPPPAAPGEPVPP